MKKIKMHPKDKNVKATNYDVDLLETLVYEWVRRKIYSKTFRLSNAILKSTAYRFKSILNLRSFCVTEEWLQNFRLIYNLKDVFTNELTDIGYKCKKSTLPLDIFNELQPKWESLDPLQLSSAPPSDVNKIIDIKENEVPAVELIDDNHEKNEYMDVQDIPTGEDEKKKMSEETSTYDTNRTEMFDIEDELPVCTIFGRKTVANVANIISSDKKYNKVEFQPMIVCTDPKNSNLNAIDKTTRENTLYNSLNMLEVEKINDLMIGKSIDSDSNSSSQNEYQDQYLKEIVRVPKNDKNACTTPEAEKYEKPLSKLRMNKLKPKPETNVKPSSEAINKKCLGSKNKLLTKPNRKRKILPNLTELPTSTSLETKLEAIKQPTLDQRPKVDESITNLQNETMKPAVVQQTWDPVFATNIITSTQASLVAPNTILYTFQMSAPNQNQLTMPYISPMTANLQTTTVVQPTTIPPIVLHFHSPMTMQTAEMLSSSEMNLTQMPSISQPSLMPSSIDLTQPTTSIHFTNCMQDQFMQQISTLAGNSLPTEVRTILINPSTSTSTTSTQLGIKPSLCPKMTTPTPHIPNKIPAKSEPTKTTCTKTGTITSTIISFTSNLTLSTPTPCIQTTSTLFRPTLSAKPPTITSSFSDTVLTYCSQKTTPTAYVPNIKPNQTEQTKIKRIQAIMPTTTTLIQSNVSTKLPITTSLVHPAVPKKTPTSISSTSNLPQTITPTYVPNCIPNKSEPTKQKRMQSSAATRKTTLSSTSTSNSRLTTPTAIIPAATSLIQSTVVTKLETNASSTSNTRLTTTTPSTPTTTTIVHPTTTTKTPTATSSTLPLATTPTAYVPNCITTQVKPRKLQRIQTPVATKTRTIMPSTLNPALTTTTRFQPNETTKPPTISQTSLMSTSTTSTQNMPISSTSSTPNTIVTKKTKLSTNVPEKKVTRFAKRAPLTTEEEVVKCIRLMEEFAMLNENFRLIGFLERLEQKMHVYKKK